MGQIKSLNTNKTRTNICAILKSLK
jgi:hypothetical protein